MLYSLIKPISCKFQRDGKTDG